MSLETDLPRLVATLAKLYEREGDRRASQLVSAGQARLSVAKGDAGTTRPTVAKGDAGTTRPTRR
jgi:hypothetical protein